MRDNDKFKPTLLTITSAIKFITGVDIRVKSRKPKIITLRKIYYKLAKEFVKGSLEEYGLFVKIKNHATVNHHLKTVDGILETEPENRKIYDDVLALMKTHGGVKEFLSEDKTIIHRVEILVDKKVVDDRGCIPKYIIDHLSSYTEEQFNILYKTRLIPFKKMLNIRKKEKEVIKANFF